MEETVYETTWRNKFLCVDCKTFDEFIEVLEGSVDYLKDMRASGIKLEEDGVGDDYAHFTTTDPKVAEKFNMEKMDWDEEEFEEFDDEEEESEEKTT